MMKTRNFHTTKDIYNCTLRATDGDIGRVKDFYFDDVDWKVRYFVVDTGKWLPGQKVLLAPESFRRVDKDADKIEVNLTRSKIEGSPSLEGGLDVTRQYEKDLSSYYSWNPYWTGPSTGPTTGRTLGRGTSAVATEPRLRSSKDLLGFTIGAKDGDIGEINDFILDQSDWSVKYLVADTSKWIPGKKVLLHPTWIQDFQWDDSRVIVPLTKDDIRNAPEFDPNAPLDQDYDTKLQEYYRNKF